MLGLLLIRMNSEDKIISREFKVLGVNSEKSAEKNNSIHFPDVDQPHSGCVV